MAGDAHRLLGSNTAASVLDWLTSRGRDQPVHIPMKTIKLSRECFSLIDLDRSGTLEPAELQAVFRVGVPPTHKPGTHTSCADGTAAPLPLMSLPAIHLPPPALAGKPLLQALGQKASLRQVTRLVESVSGKGAQSLTFTDFAQASAGIDYACRSTVGTLVALTSVC